jgi:hypothetical protein
MKLDPRSVGGERAHEILVWRTCLA